MGSDEDLEILRVHAADPSFQAHYVTWGKVAMTAELSTSPERKMAIINLAGIKNPIQPTYTQRNWKDQPI